ncbi:MAG: SUMF1/EgtB/PvdO family nonheme iron enzyme, partial [Spirochaetaceae bacterium]|nr:SUMF1/EgtB/PvdO family nonheme iron enzyme [Spirochaetaceae bacterium]
AWFAKNSPKETQAVGTKLANEAGIFDMSGNVWEWCWDWFGPYDAAAATNPRGPATGSVKITRSGSWESEERSLRTTNRNSKNPAEKDPRTGFRVVRSLE